MLGPLPVKPLVVMLVGTVHCGSTLACPRGLACGTASWLPVNGAGIEGQFVVSPVLRVAGGSVLPGTEPEQLRVGPRPVLLRFDLSELAGRSVERAVISLVPHPSWRPLEQPVRLYLHTIVGPWPGGSADTVDVPALAPDPVAQVFLPGNVRAPVRLDVTTALRAWQAGTMPFEGFAVSSDGPVVVLTGPAAYAQGDRPRLEVVVR